jgi:hypothetical protein
MDISPTGRTLYMEAARPLVEAVEFLGVEDTQ